MSNINKIRLYINVKAKRMTTILSFLRIQRASLKEKKANGGKTVFRFIWKLTLYAYASNKTFIVSNINGGLL